MTLDAAAINTLEAVTTATITTILTGGIALALQRSLRWDPVRNTFPGDDQANRLLAYTPRPPWHL